MKEKTECPRCKETKWQTKIKGKKWECRNCGYIKEEQNENRQ